jgi:hypothetical protein
MVNIKVSLHDGSYHDVNSNGMAFKEAAKPVFSETTYSATCPSVAVNALSVSDKSPTHSSSVFRRTSQPLL